MLNTLLAAYARPFFRREQACCALFELFFGSERAYRERCGDRPQARSAQRTTQSTTEGITLGPTIKSYEA